MAIGWNTNFLNQASYPIMGGYSTMPFMMGGVTLFGNSEFNDKIRNLAFAGGQLSKESMTELFEMMGKQIRGLDSSTGDKEKADAADSESGSTSRLADSQDAPVKVDAKSISAKSVEDAVRKTASVSDADMVIAKNQLEDVKTSIASLDKQAKEITKKLKTATGEEKTTLKQELNKVMSQKAGLQAAINGYNTLMGKTGAITNENKQELLDKHQEALNNINALDDMPELQSVAKAAYDYKSAEIEKLGSKYGKDFITATLGGTRKSSKETALEKALKIAEDTGDKEAAQQLREKIATQRKETNNGQVAILEALQNGKLPSGDDAKEFAKYLVKNANGFTIKSQDGKSEITVSKEQMKDLIKAFDEKSTELNDDARKMPEIMSIIKGAEGNDNDKLAALQKLSDSDIVKLVQQFDKHNFNHTLGVFHTRQTLVENLYDYNDDDKSIAYLAARMVAIEKKLGADLSDDPEKERIYNTVFDEDGTQKTLTDDDKQELENLKYDLFAGEGSFEANIKQYQELFKDIKVSGFSKLPKITGLTKDTKLDAYKIQ